MEELKLREDSNKTLNILEYTTVVYGILTFLGYLYIDTYYGYWGIRIYPFLEASEVLLAFLNNISLLMPIIVMFYFYFLCYTFIFSSTPSEKYSLLLDGDKLSLKKIVLFFIVLYIVMIYVFSPLLFSIILNRDLFYDIVLMLLQIFLIMYLSQPLINFKIEFAKRKQIGQISLILLLIYSLNYSYARFQFKDANYKRNITNFSFNYELNTFKSNDSLLYIGSTSKYIFIKNTKSKTNLIFDKENIKNLSITENHKK